MPQTKPGYHRCQVWCDKIDSSDGMCDWAAFYCQTKTGSKPINLHKGRLEKGTKYTQHVVHVKLGMGGHWPANQESWPSLNYHMAQHCSQFPDRATPGAGVYSRKSGGNLLSVFQRKAMQMTLL